LLAACALAAAVSGCGDRGEFIVAGTSSGPTEPQLPNDGLWKGDATELASSGTCIPGQRGALEVGDGTVVVAYRPMVVLVAPVGADGVLHAESGGTVLDGKLVDDTLDFTVTEGDCKTRYALDRLIGY
jgi:hypothetical protein